MTLQPPRCTCQRRQGRGTRSRSHQGSRLRRSREIQPGRVQSRVQPCCNRTWNSTQRSGSTVNKRPNNGRAYNPSDDATKAPPVGVKQGGGTPIAIAVNKLPVAPESETNDETDSGVSFTTGVVVSPAGGPPMAPVVPATSSLRVQRIINFRGRQGDRLYDAADA